MQIRRRLGKESMQSCLQRHNTAFYPTPNGSAGTFGVAIERFLTVLNLK